MSDNAHSKHQEPLQKRFNNFKVSIRCNQPLDFKSECSDLMIKATKLEVCNTLNIISERTNTFRSCIRLQVTTKMSLIESKLILQSGKGMKILSESSMSEAFLVRKLKQRLPVLLSVTKIMMSCKCFVQWKGQRCLKIISIH